MSEPVMRVVGAEGAHTQAPPASSPRQLSILIANESEARLELIAGAIAAIGHTIIARTVDLGGIGPLTRREDADVALVGIGIDTEHGLEMISAIVHEAACPVIAVLDPAGRLDLIGEAAKRGVFAYVTIDGRPEELKHALDITLRRFAEFTNLQGAFGRRATIEQAKGILMARNGVGADAAYGLLKAHSQQTGLKLIDVAKAVTQTYLLLPPLTLPAPGEADER